MGGDGFSIEVCLQVFFGVTKGDEDAFGELGDLFDVVGGVYGCGGGKVFGDADAGAVVFIVVV